MLVDGISFRQLLGFNSNFGSASRPHDGAGELARASTECDEGLLT
jgi:hypothetical protein